MMKKYISAIALTLSLVACGTSAETLALQTYMNDGEQLATDMSEMGTKFETLMNVQGNVLAWTDAEKQEMKTVQETMDALQQRAQAMEVPARLADVHPLLLQSIAEMKAAIDGIGSVATNPSVATSDLVDTVQAHMTKAEALSDQFGEKLQAVLTDVQ